MPICILGTSNKQTQREIACDPQKDPGDPKGKGLNNARSAHREHSVASFLFSTDNKLPSHDRRRHKIHECISQDFIA